MQLFLPSSQSPSPGLVTAAAQPESQIDVAKILRGFLSRWWIIALTTVFCAAGAVYYITKTPKLYASYAVLEGSQRTPGILKPDEEGPVDRDTLEELHTFEQSLTNRTLLVSVARELKLDENPRLFPPGPKYKTPTDSDLSKVMVPLVSATLRRGTRLVDVSAKFYDPETARDIVDKIIELYVAQGASMESTASKKTRDHLTKEVQRLETRMQESNKALQKFKEQNQGVPLESGLNVGQDRIKEMNAQLTIAKGQRLRLEAEMSGLDPSAASDPVELLKIPSIATAPEVTELQKMVASKEMEFAIISQRYLFKHPKYAQAQRELQDLRAARDGALATAASRIHSSYNNAVESEKRLANAIADQEKLALNNSRLNMPLNQLQSNMVADRELYEVVSKRLKELAVASAVALTNFRVSEAPMVEPDAVAPKKKQILAVALGAGMMLGSGLAFALEIFSSVGASDKRGRRMILGVPVLAELPETSGVTMGQINVTANGTAATFQQLRESLQQLRQDREPRSIAITSAESGAGKSFCAMHLAAAYAREGLRTLLIETDFRSPGLADALLEGGPGLPALGLAEGLSSNLSPSAYCHHTVMPNLYLIPAGAPGAQGAEELDRPAFHNLMLLAWNSFDRVVLDTPTVSEMGSKMTPVRFAEAVCVVSRQGRSAQAELSPALKALHFPGHAPTGIVVNHVGQAPLMKPAAQNHKMLSRLLESSQDHPPFKALTAV